MEQPFRVWENIYLIGGPELTHPADCLVYLIDTGDDLVLVDSGAGESFVKLVANIETLGFRPGKIKAVVATHAHIDHIGSLHQFRREFESRIVAHELEVEAIETGRGTGAELYGVEYQPCPVDVKLWAEEQTIRYGNCDLVFLHIPGHTPGGIAVFMYTGGKRVLFGQDVHLFGQDVHGPYFLPRADPEPAKVSLQKLVDLRADILCEGHFGIYEPESEVRSYIEQFIRAL